MSLKKRIVSYLHQHGETNTRDLYIALEAKHETVTMAMSRLRRDGFVREVRREVIGEGRKAASVCVWKAVRPVSDFEKPAKPKRHKGQRPLTVRETTSVEVTSESIAEHVAAWVAAGNSVEVVPGFQERPPVVMPVRAIERVG